MFVSIEERAFLVQYVFLNDIFGEHTISRNLWPPRLPDLTSSDLYLWGAAKSAVYRDRPRTLNELKTAITAFIRNISQADLLKVFANKLKRVQACIDARGHHIQHFCKCTATFRTQFCRKCFRIKLNGFRPV
jgi:hypothetical protein